MSRIGNFADEDVAGWIGLSPEDLYTPAPQWRTWPGYLGRMLRTPVIGQACRLTLPSRV